MRIKIYQINSERDTARAKFMGLSKLRGNIDPSSYDEVFRGDVDCKNFEDVFARFNTEDPLCTRATCCLFLMWC